MENYYLKCSSCKVDTNLQTRFLACVSESTWSFNNYPSPNTEETVQDDCKVWKISLCDDCIPKGYNNFLKNKIKRDLQTLWICLGCLAIAIIFVLITSHGLIQSENNILNTIVSITVTIAAFIGVIGVPIYVVKFFINRKHLKDLIRTGVVNQKNINKSFQGEGERLIESADESASKMELPLPKFRDLRDSKASLSSRKRIIQSVALSMEELNTSLG